MYTEFEARSVVRQHIEDLRRRSNGSVADAVEQVLENRYAEPASAVSPAEAVLKRVQDAATEGARFDKP